MEGTWPDLIFCRKPDEGREVCDAEIGIDNIGFLIRSPVARRQEDFFDCS